jgi:hypothetical protein
MIIYAGAAGRARIVQAVGPEAVDHDPKAGNPATKTPP